jgi:hypothetical protein
MPPAFEKSGAPLGDGTESRPFQQTVQQSSKHHIYIAALQFAEEP